MAITEDLGKATTMTVRQSLRFSTVLGDWSDDGHGKTRTVEVEVFTDDDSVELTADLIQENYAANAARLGFSLGALWEEYEQSSIFAAHAQAIQRELGALYYGDSSLIAKHPDVAIFNIEELPKGTKFGFGAFHLQEGWNGDFALDEELNLVLFIILQGIARVGWKKVDPAPLLFGGYSALVEPRQHVGYGLFY